MDPSSDPVEPWGLLMGKPTALTRNKRLTSPPVNYTAGGTVFAAFEADTTSRDQVKTLYEVFVAVGRPGEPISDDHMRVPPPPNEQEATRTPASGEPGVSVLRFTTMDFVQWSTPIEVLFLPNGQPTAPGQLIDAHHSPRTFGAGKPQGDGDIWTVKSMDRNATHYLMIAYYGDSASAFAASRTLGQHSFTSTRQGGIFKDHDDTNIIYSRQSQHWVDMQIFGAPWLLPNGSQTICPRNLSDNGGCKGGPRTVTTRISQDGAVWSGDAGCADPGPAEPVDPAIRSHCKRFDEKNLIRPSQTEDPPELQFYRIRPFYVGDSGRLAAHTLQYAASPAEMNNISSYGYWGPYCPDPSGDGGFIMCHKGHGYGRMHGPHVMEEWWVGKASQTGPEDLQGWTRPYKRFRAAPHDVWLMSQPVVFEGQHLWVADTGVFTVPLYRIAGITAPANGEFTSRQLPYPASGKLWLNADVSWQGELITGGCDEGCAAYVMAELQYAQNGSTVPGHTREKCIHMNVSGSELPLVWSGNPMQPKVGTPVQVRFSFRDATLYAVGGGD